MTGDVVVIGGGIAGIQASLDLADHGIRVHLIEREPTIGGHMAQLDKTFPTNDCSMCILSPKMMDVSRHPLITIHTCTEVDSIEGEAGHFDVSCTTGPRYVDESLCNGCGDCVEICPVEVYNRFDAGVGVRKAIYKPHQQAVPDIVIKDQEHCIECGLCYDACGLDAIRKEDVSRSFRIDASSIIVTTGYALFDAGRKGQYRYLEIPDVVTSLEFERLMGAGGPTGGEVRRLSDGNAPQSVIFIQCVGSRDVPLCRTSCSAVCCMYALKNAMLLKEKHPEIEVTICYMDIRAYGKGYEEYYQRAINQGVRFVRGIPAEVMEEGGHLLVRVENTESGELLTLRPDLVVLSVGIAPREDAGPLAERLGIPREDTGFFRTLNDAVRVVETSRPGIYVAGTSVAPKDIPDSVMQAGAAAMRAFLDAMRS
jgi:heterodisulfide reductase subunit A